MFVAEKAIVLSENVNELKKNIVYLLNVKSRKAGPILSSQNQNVFSRSQSQMLYSDIYFIIAWILITEYQQIEVFFCTLQLDCEQ